LGFVLGLAALFLWVHKFGVVLLESVGFWRKNAETWWFLQGFVPIYRGAQKRAFFRIFSHFFAKVNFFDVKRRVFLQNLCRHLT